MPPRYKVEQLPAEQFEFILKAIVNGGTDISITREFEAQFKTKLVHSSFSRWRKAVGQELADRYRFVRFQAEQLLEDLKAEDKDKYKIVVDSIEARLLTSTKEIMAQDPLKLLGFRQNEESRRLKERELALKERAQQFAEDQAKKAEQLQHDRLKIGADTWQFVLSFLLNKEPQAADLLTKHSEEILSGLETHLDQTA